MSPFDRFLFSISGCRCRKENRASRDVETTGVSTYGICHGERSRTMKREPLSSSPSVMPSGVEAWVLPLPNI